MVQSIGAWILLAAFAQAAAQTSPDEALRITRPSAKAMRPNTSSDIGSLQRGSELLLSWVALSETGKPEVFVSRADLTGPRLLGQTQVSRAEALGKGQRVSPALVEHEGRIWVSWIEKDRVGRRPFFHIFMQQLDDELAPQGESTIADYGALLTPSVFHSTSKGLYLVGHSQPLEGRRPQIRLFRWTDEGLKPLHEGRQEPWTGDKPVLVEEEGELTLYWIDRGDVLRSRSKDGLEWPQPEVLFQGDAFWLDAVRVANGTDVAWSVNPGDEVSVWAARCRADACRPQQIMTFPGRRARLLISREDADSSQRVLAFSFQDAEEGSRVIGAAAESRGWRLERFSDAGFEGDKVLASTTPFLYYNDREGPFLAWGQRGGSIKEALVGSVFVKELDPSKNGENRRIEVFRGAKYYYATAPQLFGYGGDLFATYFVYRQNYSLGDLYLSKVKTEREARGGQQKLGR